MKSGLLLRITPMKVKSIPSTRSVAKIMTELRIPLLMISNTWKGVMAPVLRYPDNIQFLLQQAFRHYLIVQFHPSSPIPQMEVPVNTFENPETVFLGGAVKHHQVLAGIVAGEHIPFPD